MDIVDATAAATALAMDWTWAEDMDGLPGEGPAQCRWSGGPWVLEEP